MRLARFRQPPATEPEAGIVFGEEIYPLRAVWRSDATFGPLPKDLIELIARLSDPKLKLALGDSLAGLASTAANAARLPIDTVELLAPVQPGSFRDFYAFEQHVRNARKKRGLDMVPEWYEAPVFYFSNTAGIVGPNVPVRKPPETQELDYELELGAVIAREGGDIPVSEADSFIAGFTILNDWSARDLQRQEMKVGLGPAKGKDFATSIGPFLVTPEELDAQILSDRSRGKRYDLTMTAAVNGREISRGNAGDMHWTFAELIARASRNTLLRPGDLIGSGTVGTGCLTEFPDGTYPWLQPGDLVELHIECLGTLRNRVEG
ncbi:MAG TPA: fumarylacetoacetate hydrolase family protein [Chthonomonadaceae bacterium]|nr:fumarylacetoacetate hydrolase family protein [Chthonomonadaceae bacterium]